METVIAERTLSQSSSEVVQVITRYIAWNTWDNNTYHDHERKHLDSSQEPGFFIRFPVHPVSRDELIIPKIKLSQFAVKRSTSLNYIMTSSSNQE